MHLIINPLRFSTRLLDGVLSSMQELLVFQIHGAVLGAHMLLDCLVV